MSYNLERREYFRNTFAPAPLGSGGAAMHVGWWACVRYGLVASSGWRAVASARMRTRGGPPQPVLNSHGGAPNRNCQPPSQILPRLPVIGGRTVVIVHPTRDHAPRVRDANPRSPRAHRAKRKGGPLGPPRRASARDGVRPHAAAVICLCLCPNGYDAPAPAWLPSRRPLPILPGGGVRRACAITTTSVKTVKDPLVPLRRLWPAYRSAPLRPNSKGDG